MQTIFKMNKSSIAKIIESRISTLEGYAFQDFCDRLRLTLFPDDYTPVRAAGRNGDEKNDGYCPKARIFFQDHATRGEKEAKIKTKIKEDLEGCIAKHDNIKSWIFCTNTTLTGSVESFVDKLRQKHKKIEIDTWDHNKISNKILRLKDTEIEYILDILGIQQEPTTKASVSSTNTLVHFAKLLEKGTWRKEFINNNEFWICNEDSMFQVEAMGDYTDFTEPWTRVYPDKYGSSRASMNLNIFGVTIMQISFISCDGGRINVPIPKQRFVDGQIQYFWKKNSIEYKVGELVGAFYIYRDLKGIAKISKIIIE